MNGGALAIANAAGKFSQTFSELSLTGDSTIDLGASFLTFDGLGDIGAGNTLNIFSSFSGPDAYAFRLLGTSYAGTADFDALLDNTTIDGETAGFRTDGRYTYVAAASDLQPVPEPSTWVLIGAGVLPLFAWRRRLMARR